MARFKYPSMDETVKKNRKALLETKRQQKHDAQAEAEKEERIRRRKFRLEMEAVTAQGGIDRIENPYDSDSYMDEWLEENPHLKENLDD